MRLILTLLVFTTSCLWAETTHILMVRHAETYRNSEGKQIQGWIDDQAAQLNLKGKAQADEVGKALANRYEGEIATIYSSPLGRSIETAERIANNFSHIQIVKDRRLMEICHGQYDAMSIKERNDFCCARYEQLQNTYKTQFPNEPLDRFFKWKINPLAEKAIPAESETSPFEGELETTFQLFERASLAIQEIAKTHPNETILVCTHGALIKTLADEAEYRESGDLSVLPVYYEHSSSGSKSRLLPGNCMVYHFIWDEGKLSFIGSENLLQQ